MAGLAACRGKWDSVSLWRKSLEVRCKRFCVVLHRLGVLALMTLLPAVGYSESSLTTGFGLRNQNPFLQIFGLPTLQTATLAPAGQIDYGIALDLANHADAGTNALETFVVDGETYFLTFSARRRVLPWLELGLDLPMLTHVDGFMDDGIESWHSTFGLSNTKRRGASDELNFRYDRGGVTQFELTSSTAGIGDVQLTAAIPLREADADDGLAVAVRSSVKLPTGDERELRGSGAADLSLALHVSDTHTLLNRDLVLSGMVGALALGDGEILPDLQRSFVPFGGAVARWQVGERFAITTQLYVQGSDIKELGGNSAQLAVGGSVRAKNSDTLFRFAVVEDVSANATTDFALHFSVVAIGVGR